MENRPNTESFLKWQFLNNLQQESFHVEAIP